MSVLDDPSGLRRGVGTDAPLLRWVAPVDPRREMEAFASAIAHDLRTPMNTSRRLLELVVDLHGTDMPAGPRATLREVATTMHRLEDLLEGLLRLGGVGHRTLQISAIDMDKVVASAIQDVRKRPTCIDVEFDVAPLPPCWGDQDLLRELMHNLIENACKYTQGQVERRIEVRGRPKGDQVSYTVRDNGPGIPAADAARVFQPFQRVPPRNDPGGSGLGLAIVQRIVQRHKGTISISPAQGAEICFTLPAEPWTDGQAGA